MTSVTFFSKGKFLTGFEINGHSGFAESGSDIVCAAVSSCAYMVANTLTDIMHIDAEANVSDAHFSFSVPSASAEKCSDILSGFHLHCTELVKEYPKNIKVTISEV